MHRLLIAAASAALVVAVAAPALADDYPPCMHKDQDHCKVMAMGEGHHGGHHHHHPAPPKHHDHH
jgi:Spy/CpxP family protein refolding chaperone